MLLQRKFNGKYNTPPNLKIVQIGPIACFTPSITFP